MQTIEMQSGFKVGFDELVQSVSTLDADEFNILLKKLNQVASLRKRNSTPTSEEEILLQRIKAIIPASIIRRFKQLQTKSLNHTLSEPESSEIILITDFIEEKSAERVLLLAELAKIRKVNVLDVVKQLSLKDYHA